MSWRSRIAAFAVAIMAACTADAATPLAVYGQLPTLSDVAISPDGTSLAYVRADEGRRVVMIQTIAGNQLLGAINVTSTKLRKLQWADDHTLIITTSMTTVPKGLGGQRGEWSTAQTFDTQTKEQKPLFDFKAFRGEIEVMNVIANAPKVRIIGGHTVVFYEGVYFPNGEQSALGLFRVDLTDKSTRMVSSRHHVDAQSWLIDEAGNIVAEESYDDKTQLWSLDLYRGDKTIHAMELKAPIETPDMNGISEDGEGIIVGVPDQDGSPVYKRISLKDGSIAPWSRDNQVFAHIATSSQNGRVMGVSLVSEKHDYVFFDPKDDALWRSVKAAFAGATDVDFESWSNDHTKIVAHVFGPNIGEGYFLVDMTQHKATAIGSAYAGLSEIASESWIEYKAADGRTIHAYLTLPNGREAKSLPLIVVPHGGPHARDEPGFDFISQALASRGYAVLQPQFRGSGEISDDLLRAGYGEFGKKMQTDLSDGVRALAAQGLIDPKRVCIAGISYGGYAALAGATIDTGVYRCAVSVAGLSDLRKFMKDMHPSSEQPESISVRFWKRFLGVTDINDPKLDTISPIKLVDKVTIPILLIHGKDDTTVRFYQSEDMADALKAAKKTYQFVILKGEDHHLSKSETRLQMLEETVKFLEANNPPK